MPTYNVYNVMDDVENGPFNVVLRTLACRTPRAWPLLQRQAGPLATWVPGKATSGCGGTVSSARGDLVGHLESLP